VMHTQSRIMPTSTQGTHNYMAPEAIDPEELGGIGQAADVWSLACVLVELLVGTAPWAGMQMIQISRAVVDRKRTPDVPEGAPAAAMIRRCFAYLAAERPSASELAEALGPFALVGSEPGRNRARRFPTWSRSSATKWSA